MRVTVADDLHRRLMELRVMVAIIGKITLVEEAFAVCSAYELPEKSLIESFISRILGLSCYPCLITAAFLDVPIEIITCSQLIPHCS